MTVLGRLGGASYIGETPPRVRVWCRMVGIPTPIWMWRVGIYQVGLGGKTMATWHPPGGQKMTHEFHNPHMWWDMDDDELNLLKVKVRLSHASIGNP